MSEYRKTPQENTSVRAGSRWGEITIPVTHDRRKDTSIAVSMSREELVNLRDALDAALVRPVDEIIDEILSDYEDALTDELNKKVTEKRAELEAQDEAEIRRLAKALGK